MRPVTIVAGFGLLLLLGCSTPEVPAETPADGLRAIIALYESGDFATLIRSRYAEIDKAETEAQVTALITRFETQFEEPSRREEAITTYTALLDQTPTLSDDGRTATYTAESGTVRLSRMANGRWGFRL